MRLIVGQESGESGNIPHTSTVIALETLESPQFGLIFLNQGLPGQQNMNKTKKLDQKQDEDEQTTNRRT